METLRITLLMYRQTTEKAFGLALANWPVLGATYTYLAIWVLASVVASPLWILGGFLLAIVRAACIASFLYLVEMMVRTSKVSLEDFKNSFGVYLWDVIGIFFLLWIFRFVVTPLILASPQALAISLSISLVMFVLLNAVPELIYLGHCSSLELLVESYTFITENWIEWFPPNIAAAAILMVLLAIDLPGLPGAILEIGILSLFVFFVMVMRGLLFQELHGSTRRARAFRYRSG